jgi:hypothetical protein
MTRRQGSTEDGAQTRPPVRGGVPIRRHDGGSLVRYFVGYARANQFVCRTVRPPIGGSAERNAVLKVESWRGAGDRSERTLMLHRGSGRGRRAALAAAILAVVLLVLTATAGANVYHVDGCRTPAGQVAPTDGWSATTVGTTVQATDSCAGGGSLDAIIGGSVVQPANSTSATWTYTAPPQTTIAAAILWRSATTASVGFDANSITFLAAPLNLYDAPDVFDRCFNCTALGVTSSPFDPSNRVAAPAVNVQGASQIFATAECGGTTGQTCPTTGSGSTAPPDAELSVYATDIALNDSSTPTFAGVTGTLASASTLAGTEGIAFAAADTGPGLYQVLFQIDGATVATRQIDDNGGHCVNVGGTSDGTPAFLYGQPCVASAGKRDARYVPGCGWHPPSGRRGHRRVGRCGDGARPAGRLPQRRRRRAHLGADTGGTVASVRGAQHPQRQRRIAPRRAQRALEADHPCRTDQSLEYATSNHRTAADGQQEADRGRAHKGAGAAGLCRGRRDCGGHTHHRRQRRLQPHHSRRRFIAQARAALLRLQGPASYQFRALCSFEADFPFLQGASNVVAVHER